MKSHLDANGIELLHWVALNTTNHHKIPQTTTKHHKPPQNTTNLHKTPQTPSKQTTNHFIALLYQRFIIFLVTLLKKRQQLICELYEHTINSEYKYCQDRAHIFHSITCFIQTVYLKSAFCHFCFI